MHNNGTAARIAMEIPFKLIIGTHFINKRQVDPICAETALSGKPSRTP